jgi:hypothetical protein
MYITIRYHVRSGSQLFYAVGDREAVLQAVRNTFLNHGMAIHKEKDQIVYHFPDGWLDRASTVINRLSSSGGVRPQSNCFSIEYRATNNPLVPTLLVNLYHKTGWFRDKKVQQRIKRFYESLTHEFRMFEIPIIDAEHWPDVVREHPELFWRMRV